MARQREEMNRNSQTGLAERESTSEKLQQSEEQFRLLVEGVKDYAIYILSPKGIVTTWNSGAERIKGYRAEEIIGKHFSCFFHPQDREAGKPDRALEIAATTGKFEEENLRVRKDGSVFWASVLITALYNNGGQLYGFAKVVRDITERKQAEQRLREHERLAALGTTAAVFAHEIGNPLNGLSTSLELVTKFLADSADPIVQETLEMSLQELQRLTALLNDYRSFAKPQGINIEPTNMLKLFEEVLAPAIKHYEDQGINTALEVDNNLPLIAVDREKIKQVILNLCKNAVEAMPNGGSLKCKAYERADRMLIEVADTGTGIAEGLDVFQLFRTTKPEGTGLGLPIVQQIISEHRGNVDYVSQLGKGTTFRISLPLTPAIHPSTQATAI
jgi:PAS domain S-box-containing protein